MPKISADSLFRAVTQGAPWPELWRQPVITGVGATALPALLHLTPAGQPNPPPVPGAMVQPGQPCPPSTLEGTTPPRCAPCPPPSPCPPASAPCPPPQVVTVPAACPPCPSSDNAAAPSGGGPLSGCYPWWYLVIAFGLGGVSGYYLGLPKDCTKADPKDPGKDKGGKVDWCGCDPRTVPPEAKPKVAQCKPKDQERADKRRAEEARKKALKEGKPPPKLEKPIEVPGLKPAA